MKRPFLFLILFLSLFAFAPQPVPLMAQEDDFVEEEVAGEEEGHGSKSPLEVIREGGPLIMLIWVCILATSVVMVTLVIQNYILLRVNKLAPPELFEALRNSMGAGNYQEAWETAHANDNYLANVTEAGLERVGRGKEAVEDALSEHALREAQLTRTRNSYLSVIGVVAPMIGLLGTVIGMMNAFATLGTTGIGDPRALATSIGEVLLATASGLFIAIPAFIFYYYFRNRSQAVIVHADDRVNALFQDLPYEELAGVKIGENFSAGAGAPMAAGARSAKVSMAMSTNCPICNGAITAGVNPCPHCGATLEWEG